MPTAVQFGAGNIGRGFMAQLFCDSGFETVFVDVSSELVEAVNRSGRYAIHLVGPGEATIEISGIRALSGTDLTVVAETLAECDIVCISVGAGALPHIAPNLAAGLELRFRRGGAPLNILVCENLHYAAALLRDSVSKLLSGELASQILANTGFVQAVVSRMVPLQEYRDTDRLSVRVEAYKRLPVDASAIVGELPQIAGVEPVQNFAAHIERKLFTHNCAHAALGYLGYRRLHELCYQALADPEIRWLLFEGNPSVLGETGEALIGKYGFDRAEHQAHVSDLMDRFANVELGDTCFRVARDPIRKLAPDDRLVGAARLCESQGIQPVALSIVIGEALAFDSPEDAPAVELQRRIRQEGLESVLLDVCGINPDEWLAGRVRVAYQMVQERDSDT